MSRLVDFYRGQAPDGGNRLLPDVWAWGDADLEEAHDYIQWLFPLPEASRFNPDAPLLTEDDITAFRDDRQLRANLRRSFERILSFLGLSLAEDDRVVEGDNFAARVPDVWAGLNHNWLRITRILRSLKLLGLESEAQALYARLEALSRSGQFPIPPDTLQYWTEAVQGLPPHA